jgi:methylmalonyl-CoA epimerase
MPDAGSLPTLLGIHHVCSAVGDLDAEIERYQRLGGAQLELRRELPEQGVDAASLLVGGDIVELIAPLDATGGVAKFLDKRGPGLHHVAYVVANVADALHGFAQSGVRVIDETPRIGLHGTPVGFLHPSAFGGVLTELVELGTPH